MKKVFLGLMLVSLVACQRNVLILNPDTEIPGQEDSIIKMSISAYYGDTIQLKQVGSNPWEIKENVTRFRDTMYIIHDPKQEVGKVNTVVVTEKIAVVQ